MPSDPRLAACETEELRLRFGRVGTLTVLFTLPLNGQLARHRQVAQLFAKSEEHTSELQSLMRISYAVLCLKTKQPFPPTIPQIPNAQHPRSLILSPHTM